MVEETSTPTRTRIAHLERLGHELSGRGFIVRLATPHGRPASLQVMNPTASILAEDVLAEGGDDGWWFWWPWAERITTVDDPAGAAEQVARVLAAVTE